MPDNHSVTFFDSQFQRQVGVADFALNPFEQLALPYLKGEVLDLGCGLGNLALAAARQGCGVHALDASPTAIAHIRNTAQREGLDVRTENTDLAHFRASADYDVIVCIGLLMFFPAATAHALLHEIRDHVRPGGLAIINILTRDTTFMGMFQPGHYHLFQPGEIAAGFPGWTLVASREDRFTAAGDTCKAFETVVLRRPA